MYGDNAVKAAFLTVLADAKPAEAQYVSLYRRESWYGGPEEGGWWGHDQKLVAYQEFTTSEAAHAAAKKVEQMAETLSGEAKETWERVCAVETAWLEQRGLDDDFLRETDGPDSYHIHIESYPGEFAYRGDRQWS